MTTLSKLAKLLMVSTCVCLLLVGCSRLTQANFDKVKPSMSMSEVTAILGEPTKTDSVNIAGISGTTATWKDAHAEITIQFLNEKVAVKAFNSLDGKNQ